MVSLINTVGDVGCLVMIGILKYLVKWQGLSAKALRGNGYFPAGWIQEKMGRSFEVLMIYSSCSLRISEQAVVFFLKILFMFCATEASGILKPRYSRLPWKKVEQFRSTADWDPVGCIEPHSPGGEQLWERPNSSKPLTLNNAFFFHRGVLQYR